MQPEPVPTGLEAAYHRGGAAKLGRSLRLQVGNRFERDDEGELTVSR